MVNQAKVKTSPEDHQDKRRHAAKNIIENAGKGTFEDIGRKVQGNTKATTKKYAIELATTLHNMLVQGH